MLFDKIKALCEKKGVSVWKLEKDLGFSNRSVTPASARFRKWRIILA